MVRRALERARRHTTREPGRGRGAGWTTPWIGAARCYVRECPTCSKVADEHLGCFRGLLVMEAARHIAEVNVP